VVEKLVGKGLELFAAGDLAGATRMWLLARATGSPDPQLESYLKHAEAVAPDLVRQLEVELSTRHSAEASTNVAEVAEVDLGGAAVVSVSPESMADRRAEDSNALEGSVWESPLATVNVSPAHIEIPAPPLVGDASPAEDTSPPSVQARTPIPLPDSRDESTSELPIALPGSEGGWSAPIVEGRTPTSKSPVELQRVAPQEDPWGGEAVIGPTIQVGGFSGGLDLVCAPRSTPPPTSPNAEMNRGEARLKELLELDDFTGALAVAEVLLQAVPDHEHALAARQRCRDTLRGMYESKIGDLSSVPCVRVPPEQVIWLDLDHRSGFILAQVDGGSTYEELVELAGIDRLEALRIIAQLVQKGVIGAEYDR
jgi:hypothetical protein